MRRRTVYLLLRLTKYRVRFCDVEWIHKKKVVFVAMLSLSCVFENSNPVF